LAIFSKAIILSLRIVMIEQHCPYSLLKAVPIFSLLVQCHSGQTHLLFEGPSQGSYVVSIST